MQGVSGNRHPYCDLTDEVIMKYIEEQSKLERDKDEDFKVNDE